MDGVADLFLSCFASTYFDYVRKVGQIFSAAEQVKLGGRTYALGRQLGAGGAADVHLATTHGNLGRETEEYAVKKVVCSGAESWQCAQRECDIMARRLHPGLMPLVHHKAVPDGDGGTIYMLMPLFQGGSLWDRVQACHAKGSSMPPAEMLSVLAQVADALAALHAAGWVHRDVKPHNILLQPREECERSSGAPAEPARLHSGHDRHHCVLTDLGSCCAMESLKTDSMADAVKVAAEAETYCSQLYRPPELWNCPHHAQLDGRIDVWALGCVLYFMMSGINPFEKQCQAGASLVMAVYKANVPWDTDRHIHPDLQELVHSCLRPNWQDRPTAREVLMWIEEHKERVGSSELGSQQAHGADDGGALAKYL